MPTEERLEELLAKAIAKYHAGLQKETSEAQNSSKVCFFCKKPGHFKKECLKYQEWKASKEALNGQGGKMPANSSIPQ